MGCTYLENVETNNLGWVLRGRSLAVQSMQFGDIWSQSK
jgi:hypothetical protein